MGEVTIWSERDPVTATVNFPFATSSARQEAEKGIVNPIAGVLLPGSRLFRASHYRSGSAAVCRVADHLPQRVGGRVLEEGEAPHLSPWWLDTGGFAILDQWCRVSRDPSATIRAMTALLPEWGDAAFKVGITVRQPLCAWRGVGHVLDCEGKPISGRSRHATHYPHPDIRQYFVPGLGLRSTAAQALFSDAVTVDEALAILPAGRQTNLTSKQPFQRPARSDVFKRAHATRTT